MGACQSLRKSKDQQIHENTQVPLLNVRQVVLDLLARCEVPYAVKPYDQVLHDRCLATCEERGYPIGATTSHGFDSKNDIDGERPLLYFLPTGVYMASNSYDHLKSDVPRLIYVALFTTFVVFLDDLFKRDVESIALFGTRLMRGEKQGHPALDCLASLLNDTEMQFGRTVANIIVNDTLAFLNSLVLDYETQGLKRTPDAVEFPNFTRLMSGIPSGYSILIFPADMPLTRYIQALPDIGAYTCYLNDVLSFYKEEIRGEEDNYISVISASQRRAKNEVLQKLASDVAKITDQANKILRDDPEALHAWSSFKAGYIYFHTSDARYKLDHLNLG